MSNTTTLAERLEQAGNSAAQSWVITELLLNAYPATIRQSVIAAAVPHWFTAEILAALLDLSMGEAEERYVALQQLSIVQPFGDLGHTLHDLTRSGILAYLASNAITELRQYSWGVQAYFNLQSATFDPQIEVEAIYHHLIVNINDGRATLKTRIHAYRAVGNFTAVENLLRNYSELIGLNLLEPIDQVELERQEYRTAKALADRGKRNKDAESTYYLRKALEKFAPPEQLSMLLSNESENLREQIDIYKHDFVLKQLENVRDTDDLARLHFWMSELGDIYRIRGDLEAALQQLDEALVLSPNDARTWAYRGETKFQLKRYEEAIWDFDRAIALDKNYTWAIAIRGLTYRRMDRYEEALRDFDRAIGLDSKPAWAFAQRGHVYLSLKRYDEALTDFNYAINLSEKYILAIFGRGRVYQALKQYHDALTDFTTIIMLDEKNIRAIGSRGYIYLLLQNFVEAQVDLNKALSIEENDWHFYCRGLSYLVQSQLTEAQSDLTRAIDLAKLNYVKEPHDWRNTLNLMLYHLVASDNSMAERFLQEAFDGNAPIPRLKAAIQDLEELLIVLPDHTQARIFLQRIEAHLADLV